MNTQVSSRDLAKVKTLYRHADTLALYAIPYDMRPGQSPRDLWYSTAFGRQPGQWPEWLYLGSPGWWGHLDADSQRTITAWLSALGNRVPEGPYEWTVLS